MNASVPVQGLTYKSIPVSQLIVAPDNPRQAPATKAEDDGLKNSIGSLGVVMPLIVKATGKKNQFAVYAGGRRLTQTKALIKEKKLPATHKLYCVVVAKNTSATEISMIETTMRADMHPIDQYEAFAKLHDDEKLSVAEIALHFGRTEHSIRKILALGTAHPELRNLCRQGELTVEALQAYAITDDKKKQLEAYKALKKRAAWAVKDADEIRELLTNDTYSDRDKIVKYIGLQNYIDRGGPVTRDLFQGQTFLHDTALVKTMLQEQLESDAGAARVEGWKWVDINLEYSDHNNRYGRQKPKIDVTKDHEKELKQLAAQRKKLHQEREKLYRQEEGAYSEEQEDALDRRVTEIQEQLESLQAEERRVAASAEHFSEKQRAEGGCVVTIDSNGKVRMVQGLIKPEDQKKAVAKKAAKTGAAGSGSSTTTETAESATLSQAVKDDLRRWHLAAAKAELLYTPGIMYNLMLFSICWDVFTGHEFGFEDNDLADSTGCPVNVTLRATFAESSLRDIEESRMNQEIDEYRAKLNLAWITKNAGESWKAFLELSADDVMKLVAYCATLSLNSKVFGRDRDEDEGDEVLDLVLWQNDARLAKHWRPTVDNFFGRVPKPILEAAGKIIDGNPEFPKNQTGIKTKRQLVEFLGHRTTGDNKPANKDCWMPEGFLYHTLGEDTMP